MATPVFRDIHAVLFDLDGTLVDSAPDLALAVNATLNALELPSVSEQQVRQWVGNGAERLLHRALTGDLHGEAEQQLFDRAKPLFYTHYETFLQVKTTLYPGVLEGLKQLQALGLKMACVTNKPTRFALSLVEQIGLGAFLSTVVGGDCAARKKPHPDPLLLAMERLGVLPAATLMVGDSRHDVDAARHAGCPVVVVPYGYNHGGDIRDACPDAVIGSFVDIAPMLTSR